MTKAIICPKCGFVIAPPQEDFTTLRVSKEFVNRLKDEQTDPTYEDTLRRLLGWHVEDKK